MTQQLSNLFNESRRNKSEELADHLEAMLAERGLGAGDRLPAERELAAAYGVALATVRRALNALEHRGLVVRKARSGTFCTGRRSSGASAPAVASPAVNDMSYAAFGVPVPTLFSHTSQTLTLAAKEMDHPDCLQRWQTFAELARERFPDLKVRFICGEGRTLLETVRTHSPDIVLATEQELEQLEAAGALAAPFAQRDLDWHRPKDFFKVTLRAGGRGETIRAFPYCISAGLKFWNEDLLPAAALALPPSTNPSLLRPLLAQVHQRHPEALAATFIHMPLYQWLEDGIVCWREVTDTYTLDESAAADSLNFNREMYQRFTQSLGLVQDHSPDNVWQAFTQGRILVMDNFSYAMGHFQAPPSFNLRVQPPPILPHDAVVAHSNLLALTASCIHTEMACKLIHFATSEEGQLLFASSLHNIPARRDVAMSADYLGRCPQGMDAVLASLDNPRSIFHECIIVRHLPLGHKALDAALSCYLGKWDIPQTLASLKTILRLMNEQSAR